MVYYPYGECYNNHWNVIQSVLIVGVLVLGLAVIAIIVGCIHGSKVKRHNVSSASSAEKGLPMAAVQGTVTGPSSQLYPQQIQVQGPFFMTSQRGPNGEELVMVPRRLLEQFQVQQQHEQQALQQSQNQGRYQLPPVVPPKSTTHLPQGLQQGDKAQMEDQQEHQQPQPNLNAHSQSTEPVMSRRKFEKSVKVEREDDGGAGVGMGSNVVVDVHEGPSSSGSEQRSDENE
ncbi:hypothetical protein BG000_003603, partial [Podila horticola]